MRPATYDHADLIACAQGHLFGATNARLPMPPMLMLDRITNIADIGGEFGKGELIAELDINPELWFFQCHFPGSCTVCPASLCIGTVSQTYILSRATLKAAHVY